MIIASLLAFRIYNRGQCFSTCQESKKDVLCAVSVPLFKVKRNWYAKSITPSTQSKRAIPNAAA